MHSTRSIARLAGAVAIAAGSILSAGGTGVSVAASPRVLNPHEVRTLGLPTPAGHAGLYGWGAATMLDGSVLIGDYWNLRVAHFNKDGTPAAVPYPINNPGHGLGQNQEPYGIAVDPVDGSIYLCQATIPMMMKFDSNFNFLFSWGVNGTGNGKFLYPGEAEVASNQNVYVTDAWGHAVDVYDKTGHFLFSFNGGTGSGKLKQPHGIAIDSQSRVWVADEGNYRVEVFDLAGNPLFSYGTHGNHLGQFEGDLRGLAADLTNNLMYAVDAKAGWVDQIDLNGVFKKQIGGGIGTGPGQFENGGRGVTVDGDHNIWVGDLGNFRVMKFDPTANNLLLTVPSPPQPPATGGFNGPRGVALDAAGNIFVTDTYNERIQKFGSDGSFTSAWGSRGRGPNLFSYPRLLSVDPRNGDVVIADSDNAMIQKYHNDGTFVWEVGKIGSQGCTGSFGMRTPYGVTVAPDGTIYVADSNNHRVVVLDQNGACVTTFGTRGTGPGQFLFPRGIDVDADGTVWVSDMILDNVQHFTAAGGFIGSIGGTGSGDGQLNSPFGVETDGTYIYVADTDNNRIAVWTDTATPAWVTSFGKPGHKPQNLLKPQGIDLGPDGHLYISEQSNDRINDWALT